MKNKIEAIGERLDKEIETARGLSELMQLIYAGSCSFERNDIAFTAVNDAFGLLGEIFNKHVQSLDLLANDLVDVYNELKSR